MTITQTTTTLAQMLMDAKLTFKEVQVADLTARGLSNKDIASNMGSKVFVIKFFWLNNYVLIAPEAYLKKYSGGAYVATYALQAFGRIFIFKFKIPWTARRMKKYLEKVNRENKYEAPLP